MSDSSATGPEDDSPRMTRFPDSARHTVRDELHRIRLQMEALGLTEAETDVRRAIVSACEALDIPHYLSVRHLRDID